LLLLLLPLLLQLCLLLLFKLEVLNLADTLDPSTICRVMALSARAATMGSAGRPVMHMHTSCLIVSPTVVLVHFGVVGGAYRGTLPVFIRPG